MPHGRQWVNPYTMDRVIQTKWNGIVSRPGSAYIAQMLTTANAIQPPSSNRLVRVEAVTHMPNGLHSLVGIELGSQASDADVDDVATGVEHQAPHVGEQFGAAAYVARSTHQMLQQQELALGEFDSTSGDGRPAQTQVEPDGADLQVVPVRRGWRRPDPRMHAGEQLRHRERLAHEVGRP